MMRFIYVFICAFVLACSAVADSPALAIKPAGVLEYLRDISVVADKFKFTFNSKGSMAFMIGKRGQKAIEPNESKEIKLGVPILIFSSHAGIGLDPLPVPYEKRGYFISKSMDVRSFGEKDEEKGFVEEKGIILIGPYSNGVSLGESVRLIGPDLEEAKRILDGK